MKLSTLQSEVYMIQPNMEVYGVYELEDGSVRVFKVSLPVPSKVIPDGSVLSVYGHRIKKVIGHTLEESCANSMAEHYRKNQSMETPWTPTPRKTFCCKSGYEKYKNRKQHIVVDVNINIKGE